jgi:two-component system chemotaxis response regulator CheB
VIGIVLSGGLDDGAAGLRGIGMCGGTTVVQDPADALQPSMPQSAMREVRIDYCKPAAELAALIVELATMPPPRGSIGKTAMREELELEVALAKGDPGDVTALGEPSVFTCPECHGTLIKIRNQHPLRFRCHTGHAFTADSLLAELSEVTEEAIWNTIRSIQESAMLMTHLAEHWRNIEPQVAERFLSRAKEALARANLVRQVASQHEALSEEKLEREGQG